MSEKKISKSGFWDIRTKSFQNYESIFSDLNEENKRVLLLEFYNKKIKEHNLKKKVSKFSKTINDVSKRFDRQEPVGSWAILSSQANKILQDIFLPNQEENEENENND